MTEQLAQAKAGTFEHGAPSLPQDPTRANVIYGRGKDELPTAIYAKAFDVLTIGGKLFQAPAAGELKHITVNGQSIALYGTTVYTPLPDTAMVANPVQVQPFDPSRVFHKDKDLWPAVIYAEPGKEITIANQKVVVPAAGQSVALIFDASGHLKPPAQNSQTQDKNAADKAAADKATADKAAADKAAADKAAADKAAANKAAADKAAADKAAADKAAADKAAADKAAADKAAADKAAADKAATDKAAADKAAADKAAADKAAADKAAADKAAADKAAADKAAADKAAADKAAADKAAADKAAADKAAADKAAADKAAADKAAADKAAADKAAVNSGGGGSGGQPEETPPSLNGGGMENPTGSDFALNLTGDGAPSPSNEEPAAISLQKFNLTGQWTTKNTTTSNTFKLRIDYSDASFITAIVVEQGSGYIPPGQVRFKGNYVSNPFTVTVQRAYPGYMNPYWESGVLTIADADNVTIAAKTGNLVLKRVAAAPAPTVQFDTPTKKVESRIPEEHQKLAAEIEKQYAAGPEVITGRSNQTFDTQKEAMMSWAEDVYKTSKETHREYAAALYQDNNGKWHYTPSLRGSPITSDPVSAANNWIPKDLGIDINGPTEGNHGYQEMHTHDGHEEGSAFDGYFHSNKDGDTQRADQTGRSNLLLTTDGELKQYIPAGTSGVNSAWEQPSGRTVLIGEIKK
ncbi:MAG: histone H1-like repetitive region-containing protein [Candidatus Obscuribacterales bacterium]|nr:histone H1-like repetitive region-containing protein [Candidatus Obscuribacterales bacterium]